MHLTVRQQRIKGLLYHLADNLAAIDREIAGHDTNITICWERIGRKVARLCIDPFGRATLGNELLGDHDDRWQVEHDCIQSVVVLRGDDTVSP